MTIQLQIILVPLFTLLFVGLLLWAILSLRSDSRAEAARRQAHEDLENAKLTEDKYHYKERYNDEYEDSPRFWSRMVPLISAAIVLMFLIPASIIVLAPFDVRYWVLTDRTGVVESVSNQFDEGKGGTIVAGDNVLTLVGDGTVLLMWDPRILAYEPGDTVDLICHVKWDMYALDETRCDLAKPE